MYNGCVAHKASSCRGVSNNMTFKMEKRITMYFRFLVPIEDSRTCYSGKKNNNNNRT